MAASIQWANRPADESYASLADLHAAAETVKARASTVEIPTSDMRAVSSIDGQGIALTVDEPASARPLTHWAFGQLARIAGGPADYLRSLPAAIATAAINHGLVNPSTDRDDTTLALLDTNGHESVRALTSTRYTRIFNADVTGRLVRLAEQRPQWQPAPAAMDGKRGLYLGDRDMFAFLVDNGRRVFETAPGGGLGRGFFTWNSEVGAASFGICTFLYEYVCGNHRVWGARAVRELRLRHVGDVDDRMASTFEATVTRYAESSAETEELLIEQARTFRIGETKDDVLDAVFGLRAPGLTRALLSEAYDAADTHSDWYGDPRSAWGLSGGITEVSQSRPYADARNDIDRAAGRVLDMAFGK